MQFYADISLAVAIASLLCLVIGLYKPWVMLWWEDTQNRKKVFKVYGTAVLIFTALYLLIACFEKTKYLN